MASYKVTFDDGAVEWLTPGKKDGPPEVGDQYEQESVTVRTVIAVAEPDVDEPEVAPVVEEKP